jgi:hypothetical protein
MLLSIAKYRRRDPRISNREHPSTHLEKPNQEAKVLSGGADNASSHVLAVKNLRLVEPLHRAQSSQPHSNGEDSPGN